MLIILQGCALFGGDDEDVLLPTELVEFEAVIEVDKKWDVSIGKGHEGLGLALKPATDGEQVYAASFNGNVVALETNRGKKVWKTNFDLSFTSGPTFKDGILVLGTNNGELIALDALTGGVLWATTVSSEILAPVAIKDDKIFVRTVDGSLTALSKEDGTQQWLVKHKVPRLSLRGTSAPVNFANAVLCGFDDGKVSAYDVTNGTLLWETMLTPPSGKTEIEKVMDIDAPMVVLGNELYVGSYQGALGAMALESGDIIWVTEASIYAGIAADENAVFVSETDGTIMALSRFTGREIWKKENLLYRSPTAPVIMDDSIVIGDLEGYLHWLDKATGETQERIRISKSKISNAPLVLNNAIYVLTDSGDLVSVEKKIPNS
jgi:outer membrane protein assembly factor BamB